MQLIFWPTSAIGFIVLNVLNIREFRAEDRAKGR
jgi:hypothetical protein